jgi:hypothetical protein
MAGESASLSLNALVEREAGNNRKIAEIEAELEILKHDNKRIADALSLAKDMGFSIPTAAPEEPAEPKTLPDMIFAALSQNGALTSGEVIETIKVNWNESINPENVRPTLWRLVQAGRLKKRGDRYDLP